MRVWRVGHAGVGWLAGRVENALVLCWTLTAARAADGEPR